MRFRPAVSGCLGALTLIVACHLEAQSGVPSELPFVLSWGTAGSGPGEMLNPYDVAIGPDGNVYVVEWGNHRVQKFTASGGYLGQWGSQGSGVGQFNHPQGISTDPLGRVYVADTDNHRIQVFTADGEPLFQWGTYGSAPGQFAYPRDVKWNGDGSAVWVTDSGNHRIQKFTETGTPLLQFGSPALGLQFDPCSISHIWPFMVVTDPTNNRVERYDTEGHFQSSRSSVHPSGIVEAGGGLFVSSSNNVIHRLDEYASFYGDWSAGFSDPRGLVWSGLNLYVADNLNNRVMIFGSAATIANTASWGRIKALYR
jgi:DNA-binding beta-propeller fold protein YncE